MKKETLGPVNPCVKPPAHHTLEYALASCDPLGVEHRRVDRWIEKTGLALVSFIISLCVLDHVFQGTVLFVCRF